MKRVLAIYLGVILAVCSVLGAEFAVNTRTSEDQTYASIAMDGAGNFVVVWNSYRQDGDSGGIFGQRFGADGSADGNEFVINSTTAGNQTEPAAAADEAGNFVVVWEGHEQDNEDIYGQRFDANGAAVGPEFRVNDDANGRQLHPKVAMGKTAEFVVVWEDSRYWPMEYFEVMFKLYDANGTAIEEGNANLLSHCRYPDVAMDGDGDFTVVWMQDDIYHTSNIIVARRYDSAGAAAADPCQVSVSDFFSVAHPAVACDGAGHFVVAWDGTPGPANQDNILARRYKFDGTALSDEFVVNTTTAGTQANSCASMNSKREFVIVWDSETDVNSNEREIFGQRYDGLFAAVGDEFRANTYTFEDQKYPAVATRDDGGFVTVWQSDGQDGSGYGIFGRIGPAVGSADFNGDGFVNFIDYCILGQEWLEEGNPLAADLIDDNRVDGHDLGAFCEQWLLPCYQCSQANIYSDGKIDFKDYSVLAGNWQGQGPLAGDITGNGTVDMADLKTLLFHWLSYCPTMVWKPNIYLYPQETIELDVYITFPHGGRVTASIPNYNNGWQISVEPSGIIDGQYEFLFYESLQPDYGQYEAGWVVAQAQLEDFFTNNMARTGFNQKEIDDFIEYWIPHLTKYPYYALYPQYNKELEEMIKFEFSQQPANLIRLIYSIRGLNDGSLNLQEPIIPPFAREGFTVTEWGVILK